MVKKKTKKKAKVFRCYCEFLKEYLPKQYEKYVQVMKDYDKIWDRFYKGSTDQ